ncbi:hypothetical protein [Gluconobacter wancherniae]|uniref:Response regulatory domain-containing protein n=1 Tax=Gluconobacter wancherniae NBRC 103581 TaxID=656744 RepID=A0A511B245_9PROT|nr:hypothetical protein [Gluconobacter wancherniae]MBF0853705.1 hypothetical protein [Gluconobacter wancherniae]GBD55547.1 hypothetical protein NBRC103581_00108 [Gluconobacter wancherniae NBRC 103581]GBR66569.1 hypothetical protein AA103581_2427 [Gluconobacter wancherniae NBRC 103581]GEK93551.1 hypothetical protein GWA01_13210 [Gluconobacter wancherniae NBRC 103581]
MADEGLPVIVYVDENEDAREDFYIDAKKTKLFRKIIILPPEPTLAEMVANLAQINFEALISDFRLADAAGTDYDGSALVAAFLQIRTGFPCFIRTSYDNEALHAADDVNRVYSKEIEAAGVGVRPLFERINLQIQRMRRQMEAWSGELEELLKLERTKLSAPEIDRIIELDGLIEANMGGEHEIAQTTKKLLLDGDFYERQNELLTATEELIDRIKKNLNTGNG